MSVVDSSMPNYFAGATTILTNTQEQADIAALAEARASFYRCGRCYHRATPRLLFSS